MALVFKNGDYLLIRRKIGVQFSGNGNLRAFTHVKRKNIRYGLVPHKADLALDFG
ncbi:hypothetical protein D3C87_218120 [compost metagenome]